MIELQIVVLYLLNRITETTTKIIENGLFFEIASIISTLSVADSAVLFYFSCVSNTCVICTKCIMHSLQTQCSNAGNSESKFMYIYVYTM